MAESASNPSTDAAPIYFWREFEEPYGFLSQWYESAFEHDGITYLSAEMWMMVQKAILFGDHGTKDLMLEVVTPAEHKKLGRKVKGFDHKKWDENKSRIVEEGSYHKFTANKESTELKKLLLDTGDRELVEASPYDRVWGIGFAASKAEANRDKWGENLLGKALMKVRSRLREEQTEERKG